MKRLIPLLFSLFTFFANGQVVLKGKVIDEKTKEPLAFVSIAVKNLKGGTISDIDGRFSIVLPDSGSTVLFSYVGFKPLSVRMEKNTSFLLVELKEKSTELEEVVVHPSDNPALKIIRLAIRNKPVNDPENLSSFSYNSYNKLYSSLLEADSTREETKKDSTKFKKFIHDNHLFIHESYTERKYAYPNRTKEIVLGNHLSGVKDPFFAFLATDLQPFSFYKDFISLFNKNYFNPISDGSIEKYDFTLMDTLYHQGDSIFIISFQPLPGKTFDALRGQVYISSDGYAIQYVLAQPADDKVLVESKIQQKYEKIDGHWFPVQLNSELRFKKFDILSLKLKYVSSSYLTNIHIGHTIDEQEFGLINIQFDSLANQQKEDFWHTHRIGTFDKKERNTFNVLDSVGAKLVNFQRAFKILEGVFVGRFKAGAFYLPTGYLLHFNQYEGTRIGFGFQTGEVISRRFSVEGYGGYGLQDKALKYGGALQLIINQKKEAYLKFSYKQDVVEPGKTNFIKNYGALNTAESLRNWMTSRMDSLEQYKIEFNVRPFYFSQFSFFVQEQKRNPTYAYSFTHTDGMMKTRFSIVEAGVQWRFAFRENYLQIGQSKVVTNTAYPQINVFFSHSFSNILDGQYNFTKAEAQIDHQFLTHNFGKITFELATGILKGQAPYVVLFNGKGSRFDKSVLNNILVYNSFQTMGLYEFASNQYIYLFLNQNLGRLTGNKSKHFRPELSLIHNMGIGSLDTENQHHGITFKTMEKGFFESGFIMANLFRFNYVNLIYFGFGAGGFYRYGNYALQNPSDNAVFKLVFNASF